jgi:hypothetical protein
MLLAMASFVFNRGAARNKGFGTKANAAGAAISNDKSTFISF